MEGRIVKGIWVPIEIWEAKDLSWNEKILLMEVDSFTSQGKDCYISDEYVADLLNINLRNANKNISNLIKKGYIKKTRFDGRRRYVESLLCRADMSLKTGQTCHERQHTYNNILIEEDESNLINNKKPSRFDFLNALREIGVSEPVARDWMQVRKELKAANTETAFKSIEREIRKSGMSAEECITMAVENSWRGFKAEWALNKKATARSAGKKVSVLENNMSVAEELIRMSMNMGGKL